MYSAIRLRPTIAKFQKPIGVVALVFLLAGLSLAETPTDREERPIRETSFTEVLGAHFADGDNWTTEFIFMNMGGTRMPAELRFYDSKGQRQDVRIEGLSRVSSAKFTLNPYASTRLRTVGGSAPLTQGYVILEPEDSIDHRIGATAIFRRKLPDIPTYEASVPFGGRFQEKAYFPFDHRNDYLSGVAFYNHSKSYDAWGELRLDFYSERGILLLSRVLNLPSGHHTAFSLSKEFPVLVGRVGMMVVTVNDPPDDGVLNGFAIVGFRFNPDGPFTTITPMISLDESLDL